MRETHRMVKHTQTIRRQQARDCLSVFGRFGVGFYDGFSGKNVNSFKFTWKQMLATIAKEVKESQVILLSCFFHFRHFSAGIKERITFFVWITFHVKTWRNHWIVS